MTLQSVGTYAYLDSLECSNGLNVIPNAFSHRFFIHLECPSYLSFLGVRFEPMGRYQKGQRVWLEGASLGNVSPLQIVEDQTVCLGAGAEVGGEAFQICFVTLLSPRVESHKLKAKLTPIIWINSHDHGDG